MAKSAKKVEVHQPSVTELRRLLRMHTEWFRHRDDPEYGEMTAELERMEKEFKQTEPYKSLSVKAGKLHAKSWSAFCDRQREANQLLTLLATRGVTPELVKRVEKLAADAKKG